MSRNRAETQRAGPRLRVLQVTPAYAPSVGGVETCVREVATRLAKRGVDVRVLTADPSHRLPRIETLDEVPVQRVPAWPRHADHRFAPGVARVVRRCECDVVHIQCYQSFVAPLAMGAAIRKRLPYVVTFHGGGHSSRLRSRVRGAQLRALRPMLDHAAGLIATAEWEIDWYSSLLKLPVTRFTLIPNGGDLPSPTDRIVEEAGTLIVSVGRVERFKGHHRVLAAFPHVLREVPDARLWIAGEGPYEAELMNLASELGVAHRVEIRSLRNRSDYARRLASASVATLFSEFETHPMGALEAINLGVPTLVADNSGLAELVRKGHAQAVALTADSRSHAASIVRLIRDPPRPVRLTMSSWNECTDSLCALYERVRAATRLMAARP